MVKIIRCLTLFMMLPSILLAEDGKQQPMVVSVSWTSPDTRYLKLHVDKFEEQPFTGSVLTASWPQPKAGSVKLSRPEGSLSWAVFNEQRFTPDMLQGSTEDLLNTHLTHMKDNFLWVASYLRKGSDRPEVPYFDWFDDERWDIVLHNIEAMARLAKAGGLKGIMFDNEEYGVAFWSYNDPEYPARELKTKPPYKGKTATQTGEKVRQRGRQFIKAINKSFPGCVIWTLNGYGSFVHKRPSQEVVDISEIPFGLSIVFLDGMLEASDENTIFIDGNERAYCYGELDQFIALGKSTRTEALRYTRVPNVYRKKVRVGFGIYLDYFSPPKGGQAWHSDEPDKNRQTPERLEKVIRFALHAGDGYVWVYSEYPSWWLDHPGDTFGEGVRMRELGTHKWIPSVYRRAVENVISK